MLREPVRAIQCVLITLCLMISVSSLTDASSGFSAEANKDYVLYWLPYGPLGTNPEGTRAFHIQTPNYLLGFDFNKMTLTCFSALPGIPRTADPDRKSDALFASAPGASMQMIINTAEGEYKLSGWVNPAARPVIYDAGKFCHHIQAARGAFRSEDGKTLPVEVSIDFHAWADKIFVTLNMKPTSKVEIHSARLILSFDGSFDTYYGIGAGRSVSEKLQPDSAIRGSEDLNLFYSEGKPGVAVINSVKSDFESYRVSQTDKGVTYTATVYDKTNHAGRTTTWKADAERKISFQLLGINRDHEKTARQDLDSERNSADVKVVSTSSGKTDVYKGYQPRHGYYLIENPAKRSERSIYRDDVNYTDSVRFQVTNPSRFPRRVRLMVSQEIWAGIEGVSSVLTDKDGYPSGLDVQVSKNWHGPVWCHPYTVLTLKPGQTQEQSLLVFFQNWGTKPTVCHGQLSLVGYDTAFNNWDRTPVNCQEWYEMSQGITESICYDLVSFHCQNVLCDIRPMFFNEPKGSWWATNAGGADFLAYYDKDGNKQCLIQPKTFIDKQCPCLADVDHILVTPDGKARQSIRTRSFANTDMLRCVYNIRVDVLKDMDFSRFSIFTLGAPNYNACRPRNLAWGTIQGISEVVAVDCSALGYQGSGITVDKPNTWVALYNDVSPAGGPEVDGGANRGLIVRNYHAKIHGRENRKALLGIYRVKGSKDPIQMLLEVNPFGADGTLKAGDWIEAEIEMLIYHKTPDAYIGPNPTMKHLLKTYGDSWQAVYWDARHNNISGKAFKGTVTGSYPVVIKLDKQGEAEFELTGGMGYVPVEIRGFKDYKDIALQQWTDGKWLTIDQSVHGNDFWQAQYDPATKTYTGVFNVPVEPVDETLSVNRFRVAKQ